MERPVTWRKMMKRVAFAALGLLLLLGALDVDATEIVARSASSSSKAAATATSHDAPAVIAATGSSRSRRFASSDPLFTVTAVAALGAFSMAVGRRVRARRRRFEFPIRRRGPPPLLVTC